MPHKRNLAARAGRWSARHRKTAILGWLALVLAAVAAGGATGLDYQREEDLGSGESGRADQVIAAGFVDHASEQVLVQSQGSVRVQDPRFRDTVDDVERALTRFDYVENVSSPFSTDASLISHDGRSVLVRFDLLGDSKVARDRVGPVLDAMAAVQAAHPGFRVEQLGAASASKAVGQAYEDDARRAEVVSLPITLLILVAAFGTLVAAGLPLLLGLTAALATVGILGPVSHVLPVAEAISSIVLLVGLAVGVDYSMFYIRRQRDERAAGRSNEDALEIAAATSGRAVLISGLTVMVAMSGMWVVGHPVFQSFALGTILVVAVAVLGSVTVVPATIATLGDRIDKGRLPLLGLRARSPESGFWATIVGRVLERPWLFFIAATALLVALALPTLRLHTADAGVQSLPRELPIMQTYERIERAFPGGPQPAVVAMQIPKGKALNVALALPRVQRTALATGLLKPPLTFTLNPDRTVAVLTMAVAGKGTDTTSNRALSALRDRVLPQSLGNVDGVRTHVTGTTAISYDFNALMRSRAPWVFAFVLSLAFLLLLLTFRSLVIPVTAIVLNLLSVGAAYGVLVWIFQDGHLESLLGFTSVGGITSWLPLFLFVILFGLSMDYHVFILSRIREGYDNGMSTADAVGHGIRSTASVVTSAAIVMVAVFGIFATLRMLEFKQMGVGLALAVLIDATIIRAVLLPATMKLLGDRNWYLPRWLEWLPEASPSTVGAAPAAAQAPAPAPASGTLLPRSAPLPAIGPAARTRSRSDRERDRERRGVEREVASMREELQALDRDIAGTRSRARWVAEHPGLDLHRGPKLPPPHGDPVVVRDGTRVLIRPVEPGDAPLLERGFAQLGALSRYRRFLAPVDHLDRDQVAYLTQVDHRDHEAIVAIDLVTGEGIGVARYVRDAGDPAQAEVAIVITDAWQDRGVGTALADRLAARAREAGIERVTARMLTSDKQPRHLLERLARIINQKEYAGRVEITADGRPAPTAEKPVSGAHPADE
jgi:uncharacterized membrane protein YdfJ with MMPL/SSD domain/RimJ/RimL family protein N-acetyltransferase